MKMHTLILCLFAWATLAGAEEYVCPQAVVAFNPAKPDEALGQFQAGSKLQVGKNADFPGMVHVTFLAPDGKFIAAICRAEDVGKAPPSGKPAVASNMPVAPTPAFGRSGVFQSIQHDLVNADGREASPQNLGQSKYVLIYFSAHWCPPCRKFTPKLVEFYNQPRGKGFEVVFVSSDESQNDMLKYMKEASMPWAATRLNGGASSYLKSKFSGKGIPCLVLLDENGEVLSHSYVNGEYVGPSKVLNDLKQKL